MELFKLQPLQNQQVWVNPTQIVSVRRDWAQLNGTDKSQVATRISTVDGATYIDFREPERFLEDLRIFGLQPA